MYYTLNENVRMLHRPVHALVLIILSSRCVRSESHVYNIFVGRNRAVQPPAATLVDFSCRPDEHARVATTHRASLVRVCVRAMAITCQTKKDGLIIQQRKLLDVDPGCHGLG